VVLGGVALAALAPASFADGFACEELDGGEAGDAAGGSAPPHAEAAPARIATKAACEARFMRGYYAGDARSFLEKLPGTTNCRASCQGRSHWSGNGAR
jgi:hypothetical protein